MEDVEEEYDEEELDENGEVKVVKKIRMVKVLQTSGTKTQPVVSYVDEDEEESRRALDETGEEEVQEDSEESSEKSGNIISPTVTMSSEEQMIAAEKAEIAQQFDILLKLRGDHISLRRIHFSLNSKLVQYFKKQKMEYVFTETREDQDLDNKFYKKLETFFEFNKKVMEEKMNINTEWESQKQVNEELSNTVKEARENLFGKKRAIGSKMIDSSTGRSIHHDKVIDDLVDRQDLLMRHLSECCLSKIKLKRRIDTNRSDHQMKHMGCDFSLMNYEKLAILKEYYTENITERGVEVNEVSKKLVAMEENLNQVNDQLKHAEKEFDIERLRLQDVSADLLRKRAYLNQVKAIRHSIEKNTAKMKQQSGLFAYPILLKDFEDKSQQLKELSSQLESLKQNHRNCIIKLRDLQDNLKQ